MSQLSANKNNARAFARAKFSPNNLPHSRGRPPEPHPTHPHLHHDAPESTTSGVASKNAEARAHSHTKRPRECTTNNQQGSPKAPHHSPCMTPGRHHGPGHAVGDANHTTEHRCQRATTCDGPPAAAAAIAITCHNDDQGGPLCPPPSSRLGNTPASRRSARHWVTTRTQQPAAHARPVTNNRICERTPPDDEQGGPQHPPPPLPPPGNTPASRRSARCGIGARLPHAPATTAAIAIACGHTMNRGCQLCTPPLPSPGPMPQRRTEARDAITGTYACDQQPTVAIAMVCGHHNELGVHHWQSWALKKCRHFTTKNH